MEYFPELYDRLHRAADERPPAPEVLASAPLLEDYWMAIRIAGPTLVGYVTGHPRLPGTGRHIETSTLRALDRMLRWARTDSRYYRLGAQAGRS